MIQLKALGGLGLESIPFTQPKPLVLLSYLSLEGPQQRRHLAELFWPQGNHMKSLSMALTRLRQGAGEVIAADGKKTWLTIPSDVKKLLESLDKSDWQRAHELYTGAFLEGIVLEDWGNELEEWVYTTREYLAERTQYALLNLAEDAAQQQDFDQAGKLAEQAYTLPGLGGTELTNLKRLYPLLCAGHSLLAPEVRKEIQDYGLSFQLSTEEARAMFRSTVTPANTLPMRGTSFVGREEELSKIATLLSKPNVLLLTLLGPAGVGKTRLALQFAHMQQKAALFKDGVYFVALDALSDAAHLPSSLLSCFGLSQQGKNEALNQLTDYLAEKSILLVLDNFEHLTKASSLLSDFLSKCPNLKLLVTSRERLKLEEEYVYALEGLRYPTVLSRDVTSTDGEAMQLFRERAQQVQSRFNLEQNLADVCRICQLVEGLPLGLELAASWVRLMPCVEIANELEQGLELLVSVARNVPERHRSLRAAFESSWKLLSSKEQEVLRKLSVFVGGFRREAASEVAGATIPILASLVDKSLLRVLPNGRYNQHPLLYQFMQEKCAALAKAQKAVKAQYTNYYTSFLEKQSKANSKIQSEVYARLDEEFSNISQCWSQLLEAPSEHLANVIALLTSYFIFKGKYQEGLGILQRSIPNATGVTVGHLSHELARLYFSMGEFTQAFDSVQHAIKQFSDMKDNSSLSRSYNLLARCNIRMGDYPAAQLSLAQALKLATELKDKKLLLNCHSGLGVLNDEQGDFTNAATHYQLALNLSQDLGDDLQQVSILNNWGNTCLGIGDLDKAKTLFEEGLKLAQGIDYQSPIPYLLYNLAVIEQRLQNNEKAKQRCQEALQVNQQQDKSLQSSILGMMGVVLSQQDHIKQALSYICESLELAYQISDLPIFLENTHYLAELHEKEKRFEKAVTLASLVYHHPQRTGNVRAKTETMLKRLQGFLPYTAFEAARTRGQQLSTQPLDITTVASDP